MNNFWEQQLSLEPHDSKHYLLAVGQVVKSLCISNDWWVDVFKADWVSICAASDTSVLIIFKNVTVNQSGICVTLGSCVSQRYATCSMANSSSTFSAQKMAVVSIKMCSWMVFDLWDALNCAVLTSFRSEDLFSQTDAGVKVKGCQMSLYYSKQTLRINQMNLYLIPFSCLNLFRPHGNFLGWDQRWFFMTTRKLTHFLLSFSLRPPNFAQ